MAKNRPSYVSKPVYPGGITAMRKFISENLRYPDQAKAAKVSGTVTIRYSLDYRGKVVDAKVKSSLGYGCDKEAVRVVKMMRFSVPQDRKKKVRIHQDINIHFNLNQPKPAPAPAAPSVPAEVPATTQEENTSRSVTINYVPTGGSIKGKVTQKKRKEEDGTSYGYTIKW